MNENENDKFNHDTIVQLWEGNAASWAELSGMGYDICRDHFNMPAFLSRLPRVDGKTGFDIGCGDGTNTRRVAGLGASMIGIDPSTRFIELALACPDKEADVDFQVASANNLPFEDNRFDFLVSTMCLMDIIDLEIALKEAFRVLKKDGFLQFSIVHPCFSTPSTRWIVAKDGTTEGLCVGSYFQEGPGLEEWTFNAIPCEIKRKHQDFKVVHNHRTLSNWINLLAETGFTIESLWEPCPDQMTLKKFPHLERLKQVPWFLHMRWKKPR